MKIYTLSSASVDIQKSPVEIVERKGLGHPDTLADILAESFSNKYSQYSLNKFGFIPNHVVDKVTLLGAKSNVSFGRGKIITHITACLFGKAAKQIGNQKINVKKIFQDSVKDVFSRVFKNREIFKYIKYEYNVHNGIGFDHPKTFYRPSSIIDLQNMSKELRSNDSVVCTGYAPYSETESLTVDIENFLNSDEFKTDFPETGYDIKVLTTRINKTIEDITVCIPFIASLTPDKKYYKRRLKQIRNILDKKYLRGANSK